MQPALRSALLRWQRIRIRLAVAALLLLVVPVGFSDPVDSGPEVTLNTANVGPRTMEALTQRSVLRDYKFGWANLAEAFASNSTGVVNGLFAGTANTWLNDAISSQSRAGMTSRYLNQHHKVDAVFYAPEGDLIELHDTAEYDYQILDGSKTIHSEHAVVHYVALMTPGADRWVIRQLQSVQQF
jgi:hypothetical protein